MSHYKAYPEYKDSEIQWIEDIPSHWRIIPIKRFAKLNKARTSESGEKIIYIGLEDVESGSGRYLPTEGNSRQTEDSTVGVFEKGQVLYGKLRPYLRKAIIANFDGVCSTEFLVLQSEEVLPELLQSWLLSTNVTQQIEATCEGAKMPRADWEGIGNIPMPLPPSTEQALIRDKVKTETTRIDDLITKKNRFIELLKEKRQALITHAVTKGLNPDVKMKDSGVEWIGEVPYSWSVKKLKFIARSIIGLTYSPDDVVSDGSGTLVLRSSNIQNGQLSLKDCVRVNREIPKHLSVCLGDILICSRNGSRDLIGKNIQLDSRTEGASFGAFMTVIRGSINDFLYYVFNSSMFEAQSDLFMTSTVNQLTISMLDNMKVAIPEEAELTNIVSNLRQQTYRIDTLITKTQESIALLKERRSAFITAAVTGQIDLRGDPV